MELSGGLVPGLKPAGRKSSAVVRCHSEWPLRVQCDGQPGASHTGSLYQGFLGLCLDSPPLLFSHTMFYMQTHKLCLTQVSLFSPLLSLSVLVIVMW